MKAVDVFTPNKMPTVTFINEHLKDSESLLRDTFEKGGALISISGPSKSGKTAFVNTILGSTNVVQITGAGVKSADELWLQVLHQIGTPVSEIEAVETSSSKTRGGAGSVEGNAFFVKGKAEVSTSGTAGSATTTTSSKATSIFQLLIKELAETGTALFIDDFHYIDGALQAEVARQIKDAISKNVWVICASVPYRSQDVLRANNDLQGRIVAIDLSYWKPEILIKIAEVGFEVLNIDVSDELKNFFAQESAGSPQLMQSLCLDACFATGLKESGNRETIVDSADLRKVICSRTAVSVDYSTTVERMKLGPRVHGQPRSQYALHDDTVKDVYELLLRAIALDPPTLHFQYPELVSRIKHVCKNESPPGSSITTTCSQSATIANATQPINLLEWNAEADILDIREPLLLFHLRWSGAI